MDKNWDALEYFSTLTAGNRLARREKFECCSCSGLEGFHEALAEMQSTLNFVCVSDSSDGAMSLANTPSVRRVRTVYLAMRHAVADMKARQECLDIMRELFRQFMSHLLRESTKLSEGNLYLDQRINFTEIESYFFSGCACAYFQIAFDQYTSLAYNADEWI